MPVDATVVELVAARQPADERARIAQPSRRALMELAGFVGDT